MGSRDPGRAGQAQRGLAPIPSVHSRRAVRRWGQRSLAERRLSEALGSGFGPPLATSLADTRESSTVGSKLRGTLPLKNDFSVHFLLIP